MPTPRSPSVYAGLLSCFTAWEEDAEAELRERDLERRREQRLEALVQVAAVTFCSLRLPLTFCAAGAPGKARAHRAARTGTARARACSCRTLGVLSGTGLGPKRRGATF